jgi:hypothetical protein
MAASTAPLSSAPNLAVMGSTRDASVNSAAAEEADLVSHIRTLITRSRDHSRQIRSRWKRHYQILHNASFGTKHPYMPTTEIPEIFPICAAIVGWMTDTRPEFNTQAVAPPYSAFAEQFGTLAEDLRLALNAVWTMHDYDSAVERVCWDALSYGLGIFKTVWDGTLLGGMGNPRLSRVDPFTFFPDPNAHDTEDGDYYGEVYMASLQQLDRRFPGAAKKVAGQSATLTEPRAEAPTRAGIYTTEYPRANPSAIDGTPTRFGLPGQGQDAATATEHTGVTVIEMWLRMHEHIRDDDGNVAGTAEDWRFVVIAGDRVIVDRMASTFTETRRHPYERYVTLDEGEFYAQSLVELLAPLQISLNRLYQHTEHNVWLMGNPILVESMRSGLGRQSISNRTGQRIRKNEGSELGWMEPPRLDANLVPQLISFVLGRLESASGLSAINRGNIPGGRNAQGVMDSVAEAAFVRIRLSQRQLERTLSRCGQIVASHITEFYDEPRLMAITGPDAEGQTRIFKALHFYSPQPDSETGDRLPLRFHIQVDAGSSLPTSRSARAAEADTLFAMGALTIEGVLEAHKWPGRQRLAKQKAYENAVGASSTPGARAAGRS